MAPIVLAGSAGATAISAGASLLGGILGRNSAKKQARAARQMANYNAKIVEMNAKADAQAIETQRKRFTKKQREGFAQARMSVASRGGRIEGTSLDALTEYAKEIQLDQMELKRQEELTRIRGENLAKQTRYQGEVQAYNYKQAGQQAMMQGIIGAVGTIADYQSWKPDTQGFKNPDMAQGAANDYYGGSYVKNNSNLVKRQLNNPLYKPGQNALYDSFTSGKSFKLPFDIYVDDPFNPINPGF